MKGKPEVQLVSGGKIWEHCFEKFIAKVYVPECELCTDIVNYGFQAPYLMVFEGRRQSPAEAVDFAKSSGLEDLAKR